MQDEEIEEEDIGVLEIENSEVYFQEAPDTPSARMTPEFIASLEKAHEFKVMEHLIKLGGI